MPMTPNGAPVMIKRTIEISREPAHLAVRDDQLRIVREGQRTLESASIPCEDIGLLIVDHPQVSYSHHALARLVEFGAGVVVCGSDHLPAGLLLPMSSHTEVVWRVNDQISAAKPVRKQLWKQIIVAKVRAQAANLAEDSPVRRRLMAMARQVGSGDPKNVEAQAARLYWPVWLDEQGGPPFRRDTDGKDAINAMLNYGYAIFRAAVARALVGAGLLPVLGIHHSNRSNAFCLADDLIEPLRPMMDARVRQLHRRGHESLTSHTKAALLERLTATVRYGERTGPLLVALHACAASLADCLGGRSGTLLIPEAVDPDEAPPA